MKYVARCTSIISCGIIVPDMKVLEGNAFIHFTVTTTSSAIISFVIRLYGVTITATIIITHMKGFVLV